jgi:hypothetical protein
MYIRYFILICVITASLLSCRSTKKIQQAITKRDTTTMQTAKVEATHADTLLAISKLMDSMKSRQTEFSTFSARAKVLYSNKEGKQPDFVAFIRMKKDSLIWLSLANDIGIEGIRMLITPDTIKVMDKLAKTIQVRPLSKLQELSQIPFSYADLQHIILGRAIFFNEDSVFAYASGSPEHVLFCKSGGFNNNVSVNADYFIEKSRVDDAIPSLGRRADLFYKDYEWKDGVVFSTLREIFISHKDIFNVQMKFKEYHFNQALTFPFTVPKRFKKIQ